MAMKIQVVFFMVVTP